MLLTRVLDGLFSAIPSAYYVYILVAVLTLVVTHAISQGRKTNRERDLHARIILVTGGFTPIGLTLLNELASRGAHIIALSYIPIESPKIDILVNLLRTTTNNEQIFADECDLTNPNSIHAFCTKFVAGQEKRLDAIIFAHEYSHVGSVFARRSAEELEKERKEASLATFLATTLLLPALLVAPVERDIRILNVVNPFYAAAIPSFSPSLSPLPNASMFIQEGRRALHMVMFTRHLQRILDALPSGQVPKTDEGTSAVPVVSPKSQNSNIVAISVCPGISRSDTVAPLLSADPASTGSSTMGTLIYILMQPFLRLFIKSPRSALQSVLHALFLPTPFKTVAADKSGAPEEILKPGALYRECAVVQLHIPSQYDSSAPPTSAKGKEKAKDTGDSENLPDDGELGGELAGRLVWESFERELVGWEKANPPPPESKGGSDTPPEVDIPAKA